MMHLSPEAQGIFTPPHPRGFSPGTVCCHHQTHRGALVHTVTPKTPPTPLPGLTSAPCSLTAGGPGQWVCLGQAQPTPRPPSPFISLQNASPSYPKMNFLFAGQELGRGQVGTCTHMYPKS